MNYWLRSSSWPCTFKERKSWSRLGNMYTQLREYNVYQFHVFMVLHGRFRKIFRNDERFKEWQALNLMPLKWTHHNVKLRHHQGCCVWSSHQHPTTEDPSAVDYCRLLMGRSTFILQYVLCNVNVKITRHYLCIDTELLTTHLTYLMRWNSNNF